MKTVRWIVLGLVVVGAISILGVTMRQKQETKEAEVRIAALWKKVEEAREKGLPQTAIEHLKALRDLALQVQDNIQALKASVQKTVLEAMIEGNSPAQRILHFQEDMDKFPQSQRPMMKLIMARWYWQYFERNRWRFLNRSETEKLDEKDFTTWDLPRLYRHIDSLYREVLGEDKALQAMPLEKYFDFLEVGDQPDLRPTVYDFAAWEALEFYTSAEQGAAKPEDAFEVQTDSAAFAPAKEFVLFKPETTDTESPKLQALKIYQGLIDFHRRAGHRDAALDADLARLHWVRNTAVGEGQSEVYIARLKELAEAYPGSEVASQVLYRWAQELYDRGDPAAAFEVASRGQKAFPSALGGRNCQALLARILAKEYDLKAESVVMPGRPSKMVVSYRNIERLHLRLVQENFSEIIRGEEASSLFGLSEENVRVALGKKPLAEWTVDLRATTDYKTAEALAPLPALKPGYYLLLASLKKDFSFDENKVQADSFWVSSLGLVLRSLERNQLQGIVVRNEGGEPVPGVAVDLYEWDYRQRVFPRPSSRTSADEMGFFNLASGRYYTNRLILATDKSGESVADTSIPYGYRSEREGETRTIFFTDRSLYRPGQMIHFKGICLSLDQRANSYQVLPKRRVTVTLLDVNDEKVSSLDLVTNDFGSLSGTFTAPTDRLTGVMTISCSEPEGSTTVRVEEYKRPKFQVKIDVPEKEFRLGQEAEVRGEATAYTGAPVDDAAVRFRVVREVILPYWWYWFFGKGRWGESQEIAHGTVRTDTSGKFAIRFPARPDLSVPKDSQPTFTFTISADVTDSSGETRSGEAWLRLGTVSLQAELKADDWQEQGKPVALSISTATLNGKPAPASGTVEVFNLKGPEKPVPQDLIGEISVLENEARREGQTGFASTSDWRKWPEAALAAKKDFATSASGQPACVLNFDLKPGAYKARLRTKDRFGAAVEAFRFFVVLEPGRRDFNVRVPFFTAKKKSQVEVGQTFEMLWATGYGQGPLLLEVFQSGRKLQRFWTPAGQTQGVLRLPVEASLKGGFTVVASLVKENRLYQEQTRVSVPWTDKMLKLEWLTFRSKLLPGQKEKWTLKITGPGALPAAAEMVASLYDASLDQFYGHSFPGLLGIFAADQTYVSSGFVNRKLSFSSYGQGLYDYPSFSEGVYTRFPEEVWRDFYGYEFFEKGMRLAEAVPRPAAPPSEAAGEMLAQTIEVRAVEPGKEKKADGEKAGGAEVDLSKVAARKNLNETAFFFPHLLAGKDGTVAIEFTMPEALTQWRFLGLAHTRELASGSLEGTTVTQKDLMVQPNPPRFLREGDVLEFTVKVTNMTEAEVKGAVQLNFSDPVSEKPRDAELENKDFKKPFAIPAKQSRSFAWRIQVPDGLEVVAFKAVGATEKHSDGEEGWLPVLSRRIFIQEAIPLWISGQGQKSFIFTKLVKSGESKTLRHQGLTVQVTSNPAWYAVQALPFLMEFPYECSEQVFNRLYANSLAQQIANSDPKIRRVFDQWKGTEALKSNLEKNQELKSVLLQETPWVIDAQAETQAKQRVGLLFDENRMSAEVKGAFRKLEEMQDQDGAWPWFPGGRPNSYITLYIVTGFGRLKHLGVTSVSFEPALNALAHLDNWAVESYNDIVKNKRLKENNLSTTVALYLYGRSFFLKENPIPEEARQAVNYFLDQAKANWLKLAYRQSQAHLALALNRFGFAAEAQGIMRSIKERSQVNEEMGRFWSEQEFSWWWYLAPIETQAMMIEAFEEVMNDQKAVEECKVWLLKQKQTRDWKTTKATADAVYGLLLRGENLLASQELVEVSLGGAKVEPGKAEAGTGYYEKTYSPQEIRPAMGNITLVKKDKGIAWGGVHWRYLEDIAVVTPHVQNPLTLKKSVFVQRQTKKGPVIEPVSGPLEVGDTVMVRIELRADRDMEYAHLKDHRGSGLEPVNVLSHYKYQDGLWYYESTKDTATHFFIDFLPKGTYVFEYPLKVVHRGAYQNGLASIECMYAPEFNSHSESTKLEVK